MAFDLFAKPLQRFSEKFLHLAAAEADYVRVLLLEPRFVVVLVASVVHEVELIDQPARLQHFERAVDGDTVELGVPFLGELVKALGIEVLPGLVDQIKQNLPLARQADASLFERTLHRVEGHIETLQFYQAWQ